MILTYRYRVKSQTGELNRMARAVNFVWNFCNDTQKHALKWEKKWPSAFDLNGLTAGAGRELGLSAQTVNEVCAQYEHSRRANKRPSLRYRGKRSLGWVPVRGQGLTERDGGFQFYGRVYRVFKSRDLPAGAKIKDRSNFSRDARGNWFLNVVVEVPDVPARAIESGVGIDLGLKDLAALSNGEKIANPRHFRQLKSQLGIAQRAGKKRQAASIHASIANTRRDHLHKAALSIVRRFDYIAVGNVSAAGLAKTSMAKSVNDASWTTFRNMLRCKAIAHGAMYEEVEEKWSTQTCNECGVIAGPKGRAGLNERRWSCAACGAEHDRDQNAAINLLRRSGHRAPAEGIAT